MDELSQAELNRVLAIKPEDLTSEQAAFLTARREYLNKAQADEYASVIKAQLARTEEQPEEEPKKSK